MSERSTKSVDRICSCIVACVVLFSSQAAISQWVQRGADAGHSNYVDVSLNPDFFAQAWTTELNFSQSGTGSWSERAVASDGTYLFRTALEGYAPGGDYHVMAFDIHSGQEKWRTTLVGNAFQGVSEPSVHNGIVYVNRAGHSGNTGGTYADLPKLYGLDASTGEVSFDTPYSAQWASNDRPTIRDNQVVAGGGYYGGMYAYYASSGAIQWWESQDNTSPGAALGQNYVYAYGNKVFSRATGDQVDLIEHPEGGSLSSPILSNTNKVLYRHYNDGAYAVAVFDVGTRNLLWDTGLNASPSIMGVGNGRVVAVAGNTLTILDEVTGNLQRTWQAPTTISAELALTRTHAFVQSGGEVHGINLTTGLSVWSASAAYGEMALSDGYLFISNHEGLTAFQLSQPGPMIINPTLDAKADFSNGGAVIIDGESSVNVQQVDFANVDRRGVLEFDISGIPDATLITSATLEFDIVAKTGSGDDQPVLYLHGYSGNGTLEIADGQVPANLIGQSDPILDLGVISIDLDPDYIESLLATTDYLGLLALADENYKQASFVTLEGAIPDVRFAPKLTIEYNSAPLLGDFDGDVDVDGVDFGLWQSGYPMASGASLGDGDADGDGDVDGVDFGLWQENYPTNLGASAAIPEPATLFVMLAGGFLLIRSRRP